MESDVMLPAEDFDIIGEFFLWVGVVSDNGKIVICFR